MVVSDQPEPLNGRNSDVSFPMKSSAADIYVALSTKDTSDLYFESNASGGKSAEATFSNCRSRGKTLTLSIKASSARYESMREILMARKLYMYLPVT